MAHLRPATADDYYIYTGRPAPSDWTGLVGLSDSGVIEGMGGMVRDTDGRWWAFFSRLPGVSAKVSMHRAAVLTLQAARRSQTVLHALASPGIDGAERWLLWLGFRPTEEFYQGQRIYTYGHGDVASNPDGREHGHRRRRQRGCHEIASRGGPAARANGSGLEGTPG
jgi:hypothetical protein